MSSVSMYEWKTYQKQRNGGHQETLSLSRIAEKYKSSGITSSNIVIFLQQRGYLVNGRTPTEAGKQAGIVEKTACLNGEEKRWLEYPATLQQEIVDHIPEIVKLQPAQKPNASKSSNTITLGKFAKSVNMSSTAIKSFLQKQNLLDQQGNPTAKAASDIQKKSFQNDDGCSIFYYVFSNNMQEYLQQHIGDIERDEETAKALSNTPIDKRPVVKTNEPIYQPRFHQKSKFKYLHLKNFVILDTETTGPNKKDEVVELAVLSDRGEVLYHSYFEPQAQMNIMASRVNHLSNKALRGQPYFVAEWAKIQKVIGHRTVVGHNIGFDAKMVLQTLDRYHADTKAAAKIFERSVDTMDLAKTYIQAGSYALNTLTDMIGITRKAQHNAADNCRMTLEFLDRLEDILTIQRDYSFVREDTASEYER